MVTKFTMLVLMGVLAIIAALTALTPAPSVAATAVPTKFYTDAIVGPGIYLSAAFDSSRFTLQGVKLWAKNSDAYGPQSDWIACKVTSDGGAQNCGAGKVNIWFDNTADQVGSAHAPWFTSQADGMMAATARAAPQAAGQHWRVRIELDLIPR